MPTTNGPSTAAIETVSSLRPATQGGTITYSGIGPSGLPHRRYPIRVILGGDLSLRRCPRAPGDATGPSPDDRAPDPMAPWRPVGSRRPRSAARHEAGACALEAGGSGGPDHDGAGAGLGGLRAWTAPAAHGDRQATGEPARAAAGRRRRRRRSAAVPRAAGTGLPAGRDGARADRRRHGGAARTTLSLVTRGQDRCVALQAIDGTVAQPGGRGADRPRLPAGQLPVPARSSSMSASMCGSMPEPWHGWASCWSSGCASWRTAGPGRWLPAGDEDEPEAEDRPSPRGGHPPGAGRGRGTPSARSTPPRPTRRCRRAATVVIRRARPQRLAAVKDRPSSWGRSDPEPSPPLRLRSNGSAYLRLTRAPRNRPPAGRRHRPRRRR